LKHAVQIVCQRLISSERNPFGNRAAYWLLLNSSSSQERPNPRRTIMSDIHWPEKYTPGTTDNFVSNERAKRKNSTLDCLASSSQGIQNCLTARCGFFLPIHERLEGDCEIVCDFVLCDPQKFIWYPFHNNRGAGV
jgi:hypothetical protein